MKSDIREFITQSQTYFEAIAMGKCDVSSIASAANVRKPIVYAFLERAKKYGVIEQIDKKSEYKDTIGNFVSIYLTDEKIKFGIFDSNLNEIYFNVRQRHISSMRQEISNILTELRKQYEFLYASVVVDVAVYKGGERIENNNLFNIPQLLSSQDCVFVNSTIIKMIYIRQYMTAENNLLYYNLRLGQFSVIEEGVLKERPDDEFYGILPYFNDENEIMQILQTLEGQQYDEYYQKNKDKLYSYIVPNMYSMISILRPDKLCLDSEIIKPQYIFESDPYEDLDKFYLQDIENTYNMYIKPIVFTNPTDKEILKAAAKYAKYKFFNWRLIW